MRPFFQKKACNLNSFSYERMLEAERLLRGQEAAGSTSGGTAILKDHGLLQPEQQSWSFAVYDWKNRIPIVS